MHINSICYFCSPRLEISSKGTAVAVLDLVSETTYTFGGVSVLLKPVYLITNTDALEGLAPSSYSNQILAKLATIPAVFLNNLKAIPALYQIQFVLRVLK